MNLKTGTRQMPHVVEQMFSVGISFLVFSLLDRGDTFKITITTQLQHLYNFKNFS